MSVSPTPLFPRTLHDWPHNAGVAAIKADLEAMHPDRLPLHLATTQGGVVEPRGLTASVLRVSRDGDRLHARAGVFFTEVVGGCNCHDDPIRANGYCVLGIDLDAVSGTVHFELLAD